MEEIKMKHREKEFWFYEDKTLFGKKVLRVRSRGNMLDLNGVICERTIGYIYFDKKIQDYYFIPSIFLSGICDQSIKAINNKMIELKRKYYR